MRADTEKLAGSITAAFGFDPQGGIGVNPVLEIKNPKCRTNRIYLSVDGKETAEICEGDIIRIEKSSISVPLVRVKDRGFLNVLFSKLSEKDS